MSTCFSQLLEIIGNIFDAHSVVLFVPNGEEQVVLDGFSLSRHLNMQARVKPGQGLVGWVARENKPLLVKSFDQKNQFLGYYSPGQESSIKAFMACPLPGERGVLCLDTKKSYALSTKDQKIFSQFARLLSDMRGDLANRECDSRESALAQAQGKLHGLRETHPRWSDFLKHYLRIVAEAAEFEFCLLAARDECGQNYFLEGWNRDFFPVQDMNRRRFPMGSGLVGWLFKNYQRIMIERRAEDGVPIPLFAKDSAGPEIRTAICLPLVIHKKTRGVLALVDRRSFDPGQDLGHFLLMAADHMALLLENLYLRNRLAGKRPQPHSTD
ncbi:MAG: GAF domain-containing protein [Deltaproteobacteria bacterium]|nr:GAF domain-containing protein [Deltaproteobacteria bacterium]